MEHRLNMTEDELRVALRDALQIQGGPPEGVPHWTTPELAALLNIGVDAASNHARMAVKEGRMMRAWGGHGYVYWFAR